MNSDPIGLYGGVLTYGVIIAFFGTALLVFFYLWSKGRLDCDESPKYQLFEEEEHGKDERRT